jgi:hypothetical protein
MRKPILPFSFSLRGLTAPAILITALSAGLAAAPLLAAQAPLATPDPAHKSVYPRKGTVTARSNAQTVAAAAATPALLAPPAPILPYWPVNDHSSPATIVWNSHGLRIEAANSSLRQILEEVSTDTGARIQGLGGDQRIFGVFGPGPARDVLSQLLQGSGYNILMIGDQGQGTPRQILLTSVNAAGASNPANKSTASSSEEEDTDTDEQAQPTPPTPSQPAPEPGNLIRTPQPMMDQMQQERIQQQQQPGSNP